MRQRLNLINKNGENLVPQGREIPSRDFAQRRPNNHIDQNVRKNANNYVSVFAIENENKNKKSESKVYKETQVPAETASFVSRKFNEQQPYFRSVNDFNSNKGNYLPQRTHADNRVTEKPNRNFKTFETTTTSKPYRGRNNDYLKTTTQHTIYSPTVPPYTASKYTTKTPSTRPITTTTEFFRQRTTNTPPTVKPKPANGFYITKVVDATKESIQNPNKKDEINIFGNEKESVTGASTLYTTKTTEFTTSAPVTIPVHVETKRPLSSRGLEKSFSTYDYSKYDNSFNWRTSTFAAFTSLFSSPVSSTTTEKQIENATEPPKTTRDDKAITNKFNQYTYLPKSDENSSTARPTSPTPYTSYTTPATVTDNLSSMIKTLQNLDPEDPSMDVEKLITRPGLNIPPSAGPNTLHSLAVYFATALDNLVSNDTYPEVEKTTTTEEAPTSITEEDRLVTLLSRTTVDKYNLLFNENRTEETDETHHGDRNEKELDIKSLVEHDAHYNDLDGQHSQGPLSATPRIRQLAQVFTQALSAYLDDPETFKRVLEEIRPTEPPQTESAYNYFTESYHTTTQSPTEYASYTKEDDEVLDFSDNDKTSTLSTTSTTYAPTTTTYQTTTTDRTFSNEISTSFPNYRDKYSQSSVDNYRDSRAHAAVNNLAVDLNNNLPYTSSTTKTEESTSESSYLPLKSDEITEEDKKRLTAKPYGFGVKPKDSTPITEAPQSATTDTWSILNANYNQLNTNLSEYQPFDALLPPYDVSQLALELNRTNNEEYLQSAYSQSFISHGNSLVSDRKGKAISTETTTDNAVTEAYKYQTSQQYETSTYTTASPYTTTEGETTTNTYYTPTISTQTTTDISTTEEYSTTTETSTTYPSTQSFIPQNHWSTSPVVTKLWETTLYVNPLLINHNLEAKYSSNNYSATTDGESTTTETYDLSTQETFYRTTTDESKYYTTTTENYSTTTQIQDNLPISGIQVPADGINNLLNSTELEIASSQANQLFGNLDLSEQDLLMEKMKMAESNSTVRRLILLLVSTCDASLNHNKTVQETRNYILHALLGVPLNKSLDEEFKPEEKVEEKPIQYEVKIRAGKALKEEEISPVTLVPEKTTTTIDIVTSSKSYVVNDRKSTYSKNHVPNQVVDFKNVHQNTRALELLRSLYSLAAKWSKK